MFVLQSSLHLLFFLIVAMLQEYLEIKGFFIYIFAVSDSYFLFIIYQVLTAKHERSGKPRVVENEKVFSKL